MAVLKYKSGGEVKTLGVVKSGVSGVASVNGKTGDITGIYGSDNPPPYPVRSVNGKSGDVNISEIKVARVHTEVTGSNFEHRFLKSSLPNLNTNLSIEEAILSVVSWGSNPIIPFRIGCYGDYVTLHLSLIDGDLVTIPSTLTILYR